MMARIRTTKPEFWTSTQVMECSHSARLLFLGSWNFCDDAGRHTFDPKRLKVEVFPGDAVSSTDVLGMLAELSANGLIQIYEVDGVKYFEVTGWHHQKIDHPQKPRHPAPPASVNGSGHPATVPRPIPERSANGLVPIREEGKVEEGKGEESKSARFARAAHAQGDAKVSKEGEPLPYGWERTADDRAQAVLDGLFSSELEGGGAEVCRPRQGAWAGVA
jgi:hypothetical protein